VQRLGVGGVELRGRILHEGGRDRAAQLPAALPPRRLHRHPQHGRAGQHHQAVPARLDAARDERLLPLPGVHVVHQEEQPHGAEGRQPGLGARRLEGGQAGGRVGRVHHLERQLLEGHRHAEPLPGRHHHHPVEAPVALPGECQQVLARGDRREHAVGPEVAGPAVEPAVEARHVDHHRQAAGLVEEWGQPGAPGGQVLGRGGRDVELGGGREPAELQVEPAQADGIGLAPVGVLADQHRVHAAGAERRRQRAQAGLVGAAVEEQHQVGAAERAAELLVVERHRLAHGLRHRLHRRAEPLRLGQVVDGGRTPEGAVGRPQAEHHQAAGRGRPDLGRQGEGGGQQQRGGQAAGPGLRPGAGARVAAHGGAPGGRGGGSSRT
jgi:hypothetical protein